MERSTRRQFLRTGSAGALGLVGGYTAVADRSGTRPQASSTATTDDGGGGGGDGGGDSLSGWERSTDCEGGRDKMHDSVVRVEAVTTSLADAYAPITFSELSPRERPILRTVTEEGGYGTCDVSDAFQTFVERVSDHRHQQDGKKRVYLEREGTHYGLYVEKLDQVYSY
jgi:hypothetical protein